MKTGINLKKFVLCFFLFFAASFVYAQKIYIKNIDKKSVAKASVVVQVYYKATDYLLHETREKLFSLVTDTSGTVTIGGEFQKNDFRVDSVSIKVQQENYCDFKMTTIEYSKEPKYAYNVFLVPKNKDVKIVSMPSEERNELDVYTSLEIARKLKIAEDEVIKLINAKKIKGKKIGDKYFVSGLELRKYLEE